MSKVRLCLAAVASLAIPALTMSPLVASPAAAVVASAGPVTDVPSTRAPTPLGQQCYSNAGPKELCRQVFAIVKMGNWIYVGGQIDRVRSPITKKTTSGYSNVFRFNATNQQLDTTFQPQFYRTAGRVDDGAVMGLAPSADGQSLYVSGNFSSVKGSPDGNALSRPGLAKVDGATGEVDSVFDARVCAGGGSCQVDAVSLIGQTLWLGGSFSRLGGTTRPLLAGVNPSTGALSGGVDISVSGQTQGAVGMLVHKVVPNPAGTKVLIIGNFASVQGESRYSVAVINTDPISGGATSVNKWNAPMNLQAAIKTCNKTMFGPRGAAWTQTGDAFALVAKGVGGGHPYPALCDSFSIFSDSSDSNSRPYGYNHTEIDSVMSVCMLGRYAYVGGHFKSLNQEVRRDGVIFKPPAAQRNETHYGLGVIDTDPSSVLAVSGWNQTTETGRGAGWGAALCIDGPGSMGGGVYFGGDSNKVNGNAAVKKFAFFPASG